MTSDLPLHIQQNRFLIKLKLASKHYSRPRETGDPSYMPHDPAPAPPAVRITDKRHLFPQRLEDHQLKRYFDAQAGDRASFRPLILACLATWGAIIAAAWWLSQSA
jgi:hypothetical protein